MFFLPPYHLLPTPSHPHTPTPTHSQRVASTVPHVLSDELHSPSRPSSSPTSAAPSCSFPAAVSEPPPSSHDALHPKPGGRRDEGEGRSKGGGGRKERERERGRGRRSGEKKEGGKGRRGRGERGSGRREGGEGGGGGGEKGEEGRGRGRVKGEGGEEVEEWGRGKGHLNFFMAQHLVD